MPEESKPPPTRLLYLKGTDREIGRAHAEQLRDGVARGMAVFYHDMWEMLWSPPLSSASERVALGLARRFVDRVLVRRLLQAVPASVSERIHGMCDVVPLNLREMSTALVLPDLMPMLQAQLVRWRPLHFIPSAEPGLFGCTSYLSRGSGSFLVGRNLDFPGVGYWDRYPVIQVIDRPGKLKYIGISSAGVPFAGITGVNEAQVYVALHQHYGTKTDWKGQLPFVIAEDILSRAGTFREALEILKASRLASSWAFVIADGKSHEGAIVEAYPGALGVNPISEKTNAVTHSNFFQTSTCALSGYATTGRMNWDNYARQRRLEERIFAMTGKMTPESAVELISEHYDPYWEEERIMNRTISQLYNIQSLVIDLDRMQLWLAEGQSPVQLGLYRQYPLGELFSGRMIPSSSTLTGFRFQNPKNDEAKRLLVRGFVACFDGDMDGAERESQRSLGASYHPELAYITALIQLKKREFQSAYEMLHGARDAIEKKSKEKDKKGFPPEYFETLLFLARTCHLLGRVAEAERWYHRIEVDPSVDDEHLLRLARARRPYRVRDLSKIVMPFSSYIPLA